MRSWMKYALILVVALMAVSCGEEPPQFQEKNKGYLDTLDQAVKKKDPKQVEEACKNFQTKHDHFPNSVMDSELNWYMKICDYAKKGKWEKAQSTMDDLTKAQVNTSSSGKTPGKNK